MFVLVGATDAISEVRYMAVKAQPTLHLPVRRTKRRCLAAIFLERARVCISLRERMEGEWGSL
jgi:hypothetical protein